MSLSRIVLGMHSFRCSEALMGGLYGVKTTHIGYTGGNDPDPKYYNTKDHTEVVDVLYDERIISLKSILHFFFDNHDYTVVMKKRYASSVFCTTPEQQEEVDSFINTCLEGPVVTTVRPLERYHDAEHAYHKYYLQSTPSLMLKILYEYNWDWKTWFKEFNELTFVTKLNAALSGFFPPEYVDSLLDSINIPDLLKKDCRIWFSHTRPQCIF